MLQFFLNIALNFVIKNSNENFNGPAGIRTQDLTVISRALYRLSHGPLHYKKGVFVLLS